MNSIKSTIALNGAAFIFMGGVGLIVPMLPDKMQGLSHSSVQIGVLAASFAFAYVFVQIPMGIWADRIGYKRFVYTGYLLCAFSGLLYVLADNSSMLIAGRIIQGFGEAPIWALPPAIISLLTPNRKGKIISWYNASMHIGMTFGAALGWLFSNFLSEQNKFFIYIVLCLIATVMVMYGLDEVKVKQKRHPHSQMQVNKAAFLWRDPAVFFVVQSIAFYGMGYGIFMTILPSYITQVTPVVSCGLIFVAFYSGITSAQFIGGPVTDRAGRILPMIVGLSLYSLGMIVFDQLTPGIMYVVLAVASFGLGLYLTGSIVFLNDQVGSQSKGFISGVFYCFWGLGYFFGPIIMGCVSEAGSASTGFRCLGMLGLLLAVFILLATGRLRKTRVEHL